MNERANKEPANRVYLVDTQFLSPDEYEKVKELLDLVCWMSKPLARDPRIFVAIIPHSADAFADISFPENCNITDITGQDLMAYPPLT